MDDGPDRAYEALELLADLLSDEERRLLEEASDWLYSKGLPPWLKSMAALKETLLQRLTQPPVLSIDRNRSEVLELCTKFQSRREQYRSGMTNEEKKIEAVSDFLCKIKGNPELLINEVSAFSYAIAATCQQSENKGLMRDLGVNLDRDFSYDYVIVDEAARVSPQDLLIAFSRGKRLILVGDHRQLPHIVDEKVASMLDDGMAAGRQEEWLKRSLFEYLFTERLPAIEAGDGVRRRVTLDRQFRMHPKLGGFVSRNFYERFNANEKISSGLESNVFVHDLPDTAGRPAAWIDVPSDLGGHVRKGTSYFRKAECTAIRNTLLKWTGSPQGAKLSFGVIAFYKRQAELLEEELMEAGFPFGQVKVGTVDAFQGMEFDVVILSMVRSERKALEWNLLEPSQYEVELRKHYGHLCLYNRLNVAMSRQKRLLAVAGDSFMVKNKLAEVAIPGLVDFYRLVSEEGVILNCNGDPIKKTNAYERGDHGDY